MAGLFRVQESFLQTNSWQNQAINALRYNTAQQGSVLPLIYGTCRQPINLVDFGGFQGPQWKKGKVGPLPITGTPNNTGKGGGNSKGKGKKGGTGKKSGNFSLDVMFALCQGPIAFNDNNLVFADVGVEAFSATQLNFYPGTDGQASDPVFAALGDDIGYSGTCVISGTPMILGSSPVIPNISFELSGLGYNTGGPNFPVDCNPGWAITDFLTNLRYGAGFPVENLSPIINNNTNTYGDYCQAAQLAISVSLDGHQKGIDWINAVVRLTNSALVWSGKVLRIIPFGDLALINVNGTNWYPDLTAQYQLTDDHFIPWKDSLPGAGPMLGEEDPILVTRTNPADAVNWISIEYTDRANYYNPTIITAYDQGAIDAYGLRLGDNIQGRAFSSSVSAQISAQLILQRLLYIRNTPYKFQLGWQFGLLEPMDIVTLTGRAGDDYLQNEAVRILSIEENENGNLTIEAEEVVTGTTPPPQPPVGVVTPPCTPGISKGGAWDPLIIVEGAPNTVILQANDTQALIIGGAPFFDFGSVVSTTSHAKNSGGYYFEIQGLGTTEGTFVGIANAEYNIQPPTGGTFYVLGGSCNGVGVGVYYMSLGDIGTYLCGNRISLASGNIGGWTGIYICFNTMQLWSTGSTAPGAWNNDLTANPATGVGGIDISTLNKGPYYIAAFWGAQGRNQSGPITIVTNDNSGLANINPPPQGAVFW